MHELHAILDAWTRDPADDALLATVVHVTGSAYRRPGARMFVPSSRQRVGTITMTGPVGRFRTYCGYLARSREIGRAHV